MLQQKRRLNERINISLPTSYEAMGLNKKVFGNTISKDISETGIKLILKEFYPPKTNFLLKISLGDINKIIETIAQTIWSSNIQFSNIYHNGLHFIELNTKNKNLLSEYLTMTQLLNFK